MPIKPNNYREQALKLFPWVCGRCGRDFEGKQLKELTVHHKDHNHDYNPSDGSNWELLCIYCHEQEHTRSVDTGWQPSGSTGREEHHSTYNAFADLKKMLERDDKE